MKLENDATYHGKYHDMAIFSIENMKVVSPSPDNFILKLDLSKDGSEPKSYNFIASGEHIYVNNDGKIDKSLTDQHVAHSAVYDISGTVITGFSMFDMNDIGYTTHDNDEDSIDNLLLMPNANLLPAEKVDYDIPMHTVNSNAVYGYVKTFKKSFGYPEYNRNADTMFNGQEFIMGPHNYGMNGYSHTDTLTFYHYNRMATHISNVLSLGTQNDISAMYDGFDKLFVFDPTNERKYEYTENTADWRKYQSNTNAIGYPVTNNFDNGTLLVRSIIFPKQTLNNEYSTERDYISSTLPQLTDPFDIVRKYAWDDLSFYSNGTHIVLNHKDENQFSFSDTTFNPKFGGTMVTSTYSNRLGAEEKLHYKPPIENDLQTDEKTDYNSYNQFEIQKSNIENYKGLYNQYTPELFNRENETQSDTSLVTSKHKTNVFDIQFSGLWKDICKCFTPRANEEFAYDKIKENLKDSIRSNLYKVVDEIKPVQTMLYKIKMDD